ncbi:MAG: hypothetical protein IPN89_15285 [Saprospiraceae bacterium]|nr:hypothetical protein [Saprospiraceae bacterium]
MQPYKSISITAHHHTDGLKTDQKIALSLVGIGILPPNGILAEFPVRRGSIMALVIYRFGYGGITVVHFWSI